MGRDNFFRSFLVSKPNSCCSFGFSNKEEKHFHCTAPGCAYSFTKVPLMAPHAELHNSKKASSPIPVAPPSHSSDEGDSREGVPPVPPAGALEKAEANKQGGGVSKTPVENLFVELFVCNHLRKLLIHKQTVFLLKSVKMFLLDHSSDSSVNAKKACGNRN